MSDFVSDESLILEENKRLKEEYVMLQNASDEVEDNLRKEIEQLQNDLDQEKSTSSEYARRCLKALKYIEQEDWNTEYDKNLKNILIGVDNNGRI